jgi:hypothetical protein
MAIHPYNTHSNAYNFFFHPLHKQEETPWRTVASIVAQVALTALSFGLWLIPFGIMNRLDAKKLEVWQTSPSAPENTAALPIDKWGRIHHGNNTCFIASAILLTALFLQATEVPSYASELDENSSAVLDYAKGIIGRVTTGKEISAEKMNQFNVILHEKGGGRFKKPGEGGDASDCIRFFLELFSINGATLTPLKDQEWRLGPEQKEDPILAIEALFETSYGNLDLIDSIPSEQIVQIETAEGTLEKTAYRFIGGIYSDQSHAVVYLKDLSLPSQSYILFDDLACPQRKEKIEWRLAKQEVFHAIFSRANSF